MTIGLNPLPGNGWERLPNRTLDPEMFNTQDDYKADMEYDLLADEGLV